MPIFAITRSGEEQPFLLLDAFDEAQAVEHVNNLDMIGVLRAEGYRNAAGSYSAVLASPRQVARWNSGNLASMSGPGRHAPERHPDAPAYVHFISPPDFEPESLKEDKPPHPKS
ncbi:MAG TPA: hypothetical protein VHT52_02250 [Stellaceae bacterium]|jgi:hypothetical protein|nr:hypothetical protein [Stellaceae bacterium]